MSIARTVFAVLLLTLPTIPAALAWGDPFACGESYLPPVDSVRFFDCQEGRSAGGCSEGVCRSVSTTDYVVGIDVGPRGSPIAFASIDVERGTACDPGCNTRWIGVRLIASANGENFDAPVLETLP